MLATELPIVTEAKLDNLRHNQEGIVLTLLPKVKLVMLEQPENGPYMG